MNLCDANSGLHYWRLNTFWEQPEHSAEANNNLKLSDTILFH